MSSRTQQSSGVRSCNPAFLAYASLNFLERLYAHVVSDNKNQGRGWWLGPSVLSLLAVSITSPPVVIGAKRSTLTMATVGVGWICWEKSATASAGAATLTAK